MLSSPKHKSNHKAFSSSSSTSALTSSSSYHSHSQTSLGQIKSQVTMEEVWKEINLGSLHHYHQLNIDHEPILRNQNTNHFILQDFLNKPPSQLPPSSSPSIAKIKSLVVPKPDLQSNSLSIGKKIGQEIVETRGERRHTRMIKNRESAARSRARKQAYTNELELEVIHLQAENARLMRQQEQLKMAEATQHQKKKTLQRSWTAPF